MPEATNRVILHPSRAVRRFARLFALAGALLSGLYAAMGLMTQGEELFIPVLFVALVLVGRPLAMLGGRTLLDADRVTVRRPPIGRARAPLPDIGLLELRRGLLLEWPALCLRDGRLIELAAPTRFWCHADPEFDRALAELRACLPDRMATDTGHQWSVPRLIAGPVVTVTALTLVLVDPPWASDAWPLRLHAGSLPDTCRMLDAPAHRLLPGARVDRLFSGSDDADPHVKRHTCQWDSTHPGPDGTTFLAVGRLSVEFELEHGIGATSDAAEAHRAFVRETRIGPGETEVAVPRTGDEAELIVEHPGAGFAWVTVAVRKANVEEKIDLIYHGKAREHEAAVAATGLARLGLSDLRFHR